METTTRTKVFIAEDFLPVRRLLVELLTDVERVDIVGEAASPTEAIKGILDSKPDWVVLDYQLLGGTGVDVLRAVCPKAPATRFIILTNDPTPQYRRVCMESGAGWFFDKTSEFGKVKEVIAGPVAADS